jgi:peptidoglycan/LPS O-acetylase OafA/YrhL
MVVVHHAVSNAYPPSTTGPLYASAVVMDAGVAIFFVLSGFLIYRPFVIAHAEGRKPQRTVSFWWRRVLRIVPAYWVALTFFWKVLPTYDLGDQWWRYYLFLQIYDQDTTIGGLTQAWSLCTEMSFYLLIPFWAMLMAFVARRVRSVYVDLAGCFLLFATGYAFRQLASPHVNPGAGGPGKWAGTFQILPSNIDLFAIGMGIAVVSVWALRDDRLRRFADLVTTWAEPFWAAAILLFAWYAWRVGPADVNVGYAWGFWQKRQAIVGAVAALILLPAVFGPQGKGLMRKGLLLKPVVWVGTLSYGLYLWHLDLIKHAVTPFAWPGEPRPNPDWTGWLGQGQYHAHVGKLFAIGLIGGLVAAAISWYAMERPLQRFKRLL